MRLQSTLDPHQRLIYAHMQGVGQSLLLEIDCIALYQGLSVPLDSKPLALQIK